MAGGGVVQQAEDGERLAPGVAGRPVIPDGLVAVAEAGQRAPYQLTEVANDLRGVLPESPTLTITPESWHFVK